MAPHSLARRIRLAVLALAAWIAVVLTYGVTSWRSVRADQLQQLQTVLELGEKGLDSYFAQTEAGLAEFALHLQEVDALHDLAAARRLLAGYAARHPAASSVSLLRPDGQILASSYPGTASTLPTLEDDPSFKTYADSLAAGAPMLIGRPLLGPLTGHWIFPMRYAVRAADGRVQAVVAVSWPVTMLADFWRSAPVVERATLGLLRDDGYLLSRFPLAPAYTNAQVYGQARDGVLRRHLIAHRFPASGAVEGISDLSGAPLSHRFMRLEHYPVTLFAAIPTTALRDIWWTRAWPMFLLFGALGAGGALALRYATARDRADDREQRFLIDHLPVGVCVLDAQGRTITRNPRAIEWMPELATPAQAQAPPRFLDEDGGELAPGDLPLAQALRTRTAVHNRVFGVLAAGAEAPLWLMCSVAPEDASRSGQGRTVACYVDVTARREADIQTRRSEARFRLLFENNLDAVMLMDTKRAVLKANKAATEMFGVDEATLVARGAASFCDPLDRRLGDIRAERQRAGAARGEARLLRGDGTPFEAELASTAYVDAEGRQVLCVVLRDLTDRQRVEAEVAARKQADRANQSKSLFLAHLSHELRTPLNAILGFADVLLLDRRHPLGTAQRSQVGHIHRSGEHLLAMIDDLLDLSRIEAGALTLADEDIDVAELVRQVARVMRGRADAGSVTLEIDVQAGQLPTMRGDSTRVRQLLLNLVSNAVKYNQPGGRVTLEARVVGAMLEVRVSDTGQGMSEDQVSRLFQPFDRLGRETSGIEGTGIGLVITRNLIEAMNGQLSLHSEPGVGTEFLITLPFVPARGSPPSTSATPSGDTPVQAAGLRTKQVLYIDDDPINRLLVDAVFSMRADVRLTMAEDGPAGIALAEYMAPDLALIDMRLPSMSGIEVMRRLRALPGKHTLRCVAASANAMREDIDEALAAGFDAYLTKPLPVAVLFAEIDQLAVPGAEKV